MTYDEYLNAMETYNPTCCPAGEQMFAESAVADWTLEEFIQKYRLGEKV
jgi:hypothetical protein